MVFLISNKEELKRMGLAAFYSLGSKFGWDKVGEKVDSILTGVLKNEK